MNIAVRLPRVRTRMLANDGVGLLNFHIKMKMCR
jgi:hypothetical protein